MEPTDCGSSRETTRRGVLRAAGLAGVASLAGCTEDVGEELPPNREWPVSQWLPDLPVEERSDIMAERIGATAAADVGDSEEFRAVLERSGLQVEAVVRERDVFRVAYVGTEHRSRGRIQEVGVVAGGYAALVRAGYDAIALSVEVCDAERTVFGVATVETGWARRYNAGDLSTAAYGELVAGTVASKGRPPEVDVSPNE